MIRNPFTASSRRRGFALLITIVLVAFLVLILVGLATFTRVETQVASNAEALGKARQSALTGLNIAIAKLQRYAGPDASVTARSDFSNGAPLITNNPHITGVWDTTAAGNNPVAWLVSGNESDPADDSVKNQYPGGAVSDPYDTSAANAWVFLAYDNSVGAANAANRIKVAPQSIQVAKSSVPGFDSASAGNVSIGHYAYWVGDEGTKASIGAAPANLASLNYNNSASNGDNWSASPTGDELRARLDQFFQPYHRLDQFFGGLTYPAVAASLRKVGTLEQFRFVVPTAQYNTYLASFHDITPLARGVISRTDAGNAPGAARLRVDWSSSSVAAGNSVTKSYLLQRPSASTAYVSTYPILGRNPVANYWVGPVLSEAGIFFGLDSNGSQLQLNMLITAELWNPYAATLDMGSNTLSVRVRMGGALTFTATDSGVSPTNQHTITVPAGQVFTANIPAAPNLNAGQIVRFQTNASGAFAVGDGELSDTGLGSGATVNPPLTALNVPASGTITIELFENGTGTILQTFLVKNIAGGAVSSPALGDVHAGYGYELRRDLRVWTDPFLAAAVGIGDPHDPRAANFDQADPAGNPFEPLDSGNWASLAATNTDYVAVGNGPPFVVSNPGVILFDLPRQEVTSLAQLRHMPGSKPYAISAGNGIWNTHYVSTVPMDNTLNWDYRTQARPNPYIEVYEPPQVPSGEFDTAVNKLTSLRDPNNSARYQLIRGAFNINSTSVKAWSTLLGASLANWQSNNGPAQNLSGAFFRTPHGAQVLGSANVVPSGSLNDTNTLTAVGRQLTAAEINTLAQQIVTALKANPLNRPFYSLNEFASSNVLTTAIAGANLNNGLTPENRFTAGAITPGDILAAIAPFMSARSDTFKIRAYGDTANPVTGEVNGRVWCEAIVQRVPDLCPAPGHDDAASEDVATVRDADPSQFIFGRKFQIVSFRWLNSDDL